MNKDILLELQSKLKELVELQSELKQLEIKNKKNIKRLQYFFWPPFIFFTTILILAIVTKIYLNV